MILGIDVGGTKTLMARFNESGEIIERTKFSTPADYNEFITELCAAVEAQSGVETIEAIGMSLPGTVNYEKNILEHFGNLGWENVAPHTDLNEKFSIPVKMDNDANIGALHEALRGAAKDYNSVCYITLSTGIGSGFVFNGQIVPMLARSEAGAQFFNREDTKFVKWESFASGKAFYDRYQCFAEDETRQEVWDEYAADVAVGLRNIISVINPEIIVFGGSVGAQLDKFKDALEASLYDVNREFPVKPVLSVAEAGENSVIYGCFDLATHS